MNGFYIETERLVIRRFEPSDAADVLEYLAHPTVNCFSDMKISDLRQAQSLIEKRRRSRHCKYFAICLKAANKVIGEIFCYAENKSKDTFFPCWMLNTNFCNRGYAYEAIAAFFDYLFESKQARRIYIYTEDYNLPCQKLCEKLGMRREGLFTEFVSFVNNADGSPLYENTYQYAILKSEWKHPHK